MLTSTPIISLLTSSLLLSTAVFGSPTPNTSPSATSDAHPGRGLTARQQCQPAVPLRCDGSAITYRDGNIFIADCRWSNLRCVENGFSGLGAKCQSESATLLAKIDLG
ncbi:uncharacterized protein RCO7_14553 [Rhynchosporium graminicola]|uniref:Cyanovirin-N domain-containing protein n=1 Tax=Rhynchosporium graminicola TaxID=2792576 RepID=A0A1E1KNR9_9HELO|nr:uncharacterized protein RCO7_14553 [Rhynchosporium commune]